MSQQQVHINIGCTKEGEWHVLSQAGKILGRFDSEEKATEFSDKLMRAVSILLTEMGHGVNFRKIERKILYEGEGRPIDEIIALRDRSTESIH